MTQATWILHGNILERLVYHGRSLPEAITAAGHRFSIIEWETGQTPPTSDVDANQPVVLFGSHPFVRAINPSGKYQPGQLGVNERTTASAYMSNLPLEWFMNRDGFFLPWAVFKLRAKELFYTWDTDRLFIRPNTGFKSFAGQVVKFGTIDEDINGLNQLTGIMDENMILVAPPQKILGEFRFVVADGKVVTGSEYRWDGRLDIRRDWTPECEDLARQVAEHPWQVDIAYTCDVALLEEGPRLVELNGFSCAGMYACDIDKVVRAVSDAAIKEFYGDDIS